MKKKFTSYITTILFLTLLFSLTVANCLHEKADFSINENRSLSSFPSLAFSNNFYLIIAALICSFPIAGLIKKASEKSFAVNVAATFMRIPVNLALILVSSVMLVDATNNPFLYFRF